LRLYNTAVVFLLLVCVYSSSRIISAQQVFCDSLGRDICKNWIQYNSNSRN